METKINISAILKDKPQETKLYDWLHNIDVELDTISTTDTETVVWCTNETNNNTTCHRGYSEFGTERGYPDGLQILFPSKEMRDWAKFSWKKGDVLISKDNVYIIFEEFEDDTYTRFKGKHYLWEECSVEYYDKEKTKILTSAFEKAADDVAQTYIKTIEEHLDGKLNLETLEIEKVQLKFKDGDVITIKPYIGDKLIYLFKSEDDEKYYGHAFLDGNIAIVNEDSYCQKDFCTARLSTEEEQKQLFDGLAKKHVYWDCEHKEIIELKPKWTPKSFDRVITRNDADEVWTANIFSHMDSHGEYVTIACVGGYTQCLPYNEETAKLIGTTDNWEG